MERGLDDGLREELADDASEACSEGALRHRGTPGPFVALQYPLLLLHLEGTAAPARVEVVASLFLNLLGVGLLAAPRALARAGLLGGLLALVTVAAASRQSLLLLLELGETGDGTERPYPELGRRAFGPQGLAAVLLAHLLYAGGLLTAYLAALADLVGQGVAAFTGSPSTLPRSVHVLIALAVCAPGALERPLRYSAPASGACALGVALLVVTLLMVSVVELLPPWFPGAPKEPEGVADELTFAVSAPSGILAAASVFALHFSVHVGAIEAFGAPGEEASPARAQEMEAPDRRSFGRCDRPDGRPRPAGCEGGVEAASYQAFMAAAPLVGALGVVGYLRFGNRVAGDVLMSFRSDNYGTDGGNSFWNVAFMLAKIAYGLALASASKFLAAPCRTAALELFLVRRSAGGASSRLFRRSSAAVLGACGALAWLVPDLAELLTFLGAWAAGPLVFVLPALIAMELARQREGRHWVSLGNVLPLGLLALGAALPLSSFGGFVSVALNQPAGHRGHRVTVHSLANITR